MDFTLIETMRWDPFGGFLRLKRHLRRLLVSAEQLGFAEPTNVTAKLSDATADALGPLRVRLQVQRDGHCSVSTAPFDPVTASKQWAVRIARHTVAENSEIGRFKTSLRHIYDAARAEYSANEADEVLIVNCRGEICEGTMTNIFVLDRSGQLFTPSLSCGVLPGILREELIETGRASCRILHVADLDGRKVFLGNSLRGLMRARVLSP